MDTTTKHFIIFENNSFSSLTPVGKHTLTDDELKGLKAGYVLVISDSELFYTTMEFPDAPKRKLDMFISNYLQGTFPQQLCLRFCYMSKDDKILIGLFSASFEEVLEQYGYVFSKAAYITSPMAGVYRDNSTFSYISAGLPVYVEDGIIVNTESSESPLDPNMTPAQEAKLTLPFVKSGSTSYGIYKVPAAVLLSCFILFTAGEYFRLKVYKNNLKQAEMMLSGIYKKAGVDKARDPYGMLLSKAGGDDDTGSYRTLFVLEKISRAHNPNITTDSIDIKGNNVTFQGSSKDYTFLEEFKKSLTEVTGKEAQIVDTVKKDTDITFTLRLEI